MIQSTSNKTGFELCIISKESFPDSEKISTSTPTQSVKYKNPALICHFCIKLSKLPSLDKTSLRGFVVLL